MQKLSIHKSLQGVWTHSHEEDAAGTSVFRLENTVSAPSRGRISFELYADGRARYRAPGASDVPTEEAALWKLIAPDVLIISQGQKELLRADVITATPEKIELRIRKE
jgi:hypothetical protein